MSINMSRNPVKDTFLLDNIYKDRRSIGIILSNIDCSQLAFEILSQIYIFLDKTNKVEISCFCQEWVMPCLTPPTALYHMKDLMGYRGNIISTTIDGIVDANRIKTIKNIIWYIYDPLELGNYKAEDLNNLLSEVDNIIITARCSDYIKLASNIIDNKDITIIEKPILNFNINDFCQLLFNKSFIKD